MEAMPPRRKTFWSPSAAAWRFSRTIFFICRDARPGRTRASVRPKRPCEEGGEVLHQLLPRTPQTMALAAGLVQRPHDRLADDVGVIGPAGHAVVRGVAHDLGPFMTPLDQKRL